jgi:hypothetical protein
MKYKVDSKSKLIVFLLSLFMAKNLTRLGYEQ